MIDISVAGDEYEIRLIPAARGDVLGADRQKRIRQAHILP